MVRFLSASIRRATLRCFPAVKGRPLPHQCLSIFQLELTRTLHDDTSEDTKAQNDDIISKDPTDEWNDYKRSFFHRFRWATFEDQYKAGSKAVVHGFIGKRKDIGSSLSFCEIDIWNPKASIQIVSNCKEQDSPQYRVHQNLKSIPTYSPVVAIGTLQESRRIAVNPLLKDAKMWDLELQEIQCLAPFPKDIIVSKDAVWPPKSRHLQLRFDPFLRDRLRLRDLIQSTLTSALQKKEFIQVETPVLFKSTPEGAREFLVPTRRQGYAYALPQSPQQYKQILMAGGISRYFQFAKCFRDEDHRADRQPEFTQLDLEMAFATGRDVRYTVAYLLRNISKCLRRKGIPIYIKLTRDPGSFSRNSTETATIEAVSENDVKSPDMTDSSPAKRKFRNPTIPSMTYEYAMTTFGTDKPDLRIRAPHVSNIAPMENLPQEFIKMITSLESPLVEGCKFRLGVPPDRAGEFIRKFMDSIPNSTLNLSRESMSSVFIYDSGKPLSGLSSLGHEAAEMVEKIDSESWPKCQDGDIIIMHARKDQPFYGEGSTDLGRLRTAIHEAAVQQGLLSKERGLWPIWIYDFPLFTPSGDEPGQGGAAGFSSTHHPFTAPKTPEDFDLLKTDPLKAKAEHYDLVINGVEVGGGSQRIHIAKVQEYIMRDVLKMSDAGVAEFSHLLEALRAGCPPHAGFAFGFDRFLSLILDVPSVRDVIAFPKNNKGEDPLVGSPAKITPEQQKTYHILSHPDT